MSRVLIETATKLASAIDKYKHDHVNPTVIDRTQAQYPGRLYLWSRTDNHGYSYQGTDNEGNKISVNLQDGVVTATREVKRWQSSTMISITPGHEFVLNLEGHRTEASLRSDLDDLVSTINRLK